MNRNEIIELLKEEVLKVVFQKKDGTVRSMECTLRSDTVPPLESEGKKTPNEEVIPCWDLEKKGWRSFRVDSIIDIHRQSEGTPRVGAIKG